MQSITVSALALALASAVSAQNTAFVVNNCTFPIQLSTAGGNNAPVTQNINPGDFFQQSISGSGAALMARITSGGDDNELDYSLTNALYYALGGNDGFAAFQQYGASIVPSDETCESVICPPNDTSCPIGTTYSCPTSANSNLNFTLCI